MAKGSNPNRKWIREQTLTKNHLITMMNPSIDNQDNGVNERVATGNPLSPGNGAVEDQAAQGRQPVTGTTRRRRYTREDNRVILMCYYKSRPDEKGYRQCMYNIWKDQSEFDITEQRLADQVRTIKKNKWFTTEEMDEIKREAEGSGGENARENVRRGMDQELAGSTMAESARAGMPMANAIREPRSEYEQELVKEIKDARSRLAEHRPKPRALRHIDRGKIMSEIHRLDKVLDCVETNNITELNDTIMACACIITERLNPTKETRRRPNHEPEWKVRLLKKAKEIRQDLSRVTESRERDLEDPMKRRLTKKYKIKTKGFDVVIEELKQNLKAVTQKIKRFTDRVEQYNQNRLFVNNQRQFYRKLQGNGNNNEGEAPEKEASRVFWQAIWSEPEKHNNVEWMNRVRMKLEHVQKQDDLDITTEDVKRVLSKVPNWKAPGPDGVQGFWLKNLKSLHERIRNFLQECLENGNVPRWMTTGKTALIMKDVTKGNHPGNYRPITCLPLMWKTLTGIVASKLYDHLDTQGVIGEEQKGCIRRTQGTKDHLMLDKNLMRDSKKRSSNLAIAWIDYQKAYDMLPHPWIIETMKLTGMARNVIELISNSMRTWNTRLEYLGDEIAGVDIRRGIFQGDSLSPLLFITALIPLSVLLREASQGYKFREGRKVNHLLYMDDLKLYGKSKNELESLVNTVRIFSEDIKMKFGLQKCASVLMKRGKKVEDAGIQMPDGQLIQDLGNESYKYLGVLEADKIKMEEMKNKVRKDYYRRIRKVLQSKLNGGNVIKAMNSWAVAAVRYTAGIVDWKVDELKNMDRKTRKIMTMNHALHPKADVDRLYVSRGQGGRGMMSIEECVRLEEHNLSDYLKRSGLNEDSVMNDFLRDKTKAELKKEQSRGRMDGWKDKPLHGQYPTKSDTLEISSWEWLKNGWMKKETEGLLLAAQDQALPTRNYKVTIMKEEGSKKCRMCGERDETVMHLISECEKLAQGEYKKRHDRVASIIHWELCGLHGFNRHKNWYEHTAQPVLENDSIKILWDFNIHTDRVIEARRPDIVVVNKVHAEAVIIDVAVPGDFRVRDKEVEKISKYQDLALEINRMWGQRTSVVPIVVGALGAKHKLADWLALLGVNDKKCCNTIQQAALLGTAHVLRKVLSIPV